MPPSDRRSPLVELTVGATRVSAVFAARASLAAARFPLSVAAGVTGAARRGAPDARRAAAAPPEASAAEARPVEARSPDEVPPVAPEAPVAPLRRTRGHASSGRTRQGELTASAAAQQRARRRAGDAAAGGPGPELHVDVPWEGYDDQPPDEVVARLDGSDETTRAVVRLYEAAHAGRDEVLRATEAG